MTASVKVEGLFELIWVAPLAVMFVALSWSLCVLAITRMSEMRRTGAGGSAVAYGALGFLAIAAFTASVVLAIWVIVAG